MDYRSRALSLAQVKTAIAAHDYAEAIRRPLNLALDIHWALTRFANDGRREAVPLLIASLRHFLGHRGVGFYTIAVRECHEPYGEHFHILAHVPLEMHEAIAKHTRKFLRGNRRPQKRALVSKPIYYSRGKLAYILKGSTPPARELLEQFNIAGDRRGKLDECQGIIIGKRLLISQALGPKTRLGASNDIAKPSKGAVIGIVHSGVGRIPQRPAQTLSGVPTVSVRPVAVPVGPPADAASGLPWTCRSIRTADNVVELPESVG